MLISLSEIMNISGSVKHFTVPFEADEVFVGNGTYGIKYKDDVKLDIKNLGDRKIGIEAKGEFTLSVPCNRCLKEVDVTVPVDLSREVDMWLTSEERSQNLEDTEYINGYDLDTEKLISEEIMLGFPMKVLCGPECKGICIVCGADLNQGECGCDRTVPDPRMAVIRELFNKR